MLDMWVLEIHSIANSMIYHHRLDAARQDKVLYQNYTQLHQ